MRRYIGDVDMPLLWRYNERDGVSNHQPRNCLLNRLFRGRPKKAFKLRVTGLCEGNSPVNCEFLAQKASSAENVSISWRHHTENADLKSKSLIFSLVKTKENITDTQNVFLTSRMAFLISGIRFLISKIESELRYLWNRKNVLFIISSVADTKKWITANVL